VNLREFKEAMYLQYGEPSHYEKDIFEEWAFDVSESGGNLKGMLFDIIKNYGYNRFPAFSFYSKFYAMGTKLGREEKAVDNFLRSTHSLDTRKLYGQCKQIFHDDSPTELERIFFCYWSDFYSIVNWMVQKEFKRESIKINAELVKKKVIEGRPYNEIYLEVVGEFDRPKGVDKKRFEGMRHIGELLEVAF